MFRWYRNAAKCYVYLSDVSAAGDYDSNCNDTSECPWEAAFCKSRWFRRGWTLQELLAPASVDFFSQEGTHLGSKNILGDLVHRITKIPVAALQGKVLSSFSVEERFNWSAGRNTKRSEDMAYCLLGIFDISMSTRYGEGENEIQRLKDKIGKRKRRAAELEDFEKFSSVAGEHPIGSQRKSDESHWRKIQGTLYFAEMNLRQEQVSAANHDTFKWIFKSEENKCKRWDSFKAWLENDQDMYSIAGKAGSGKSTLMKYIIETGMKESALSSTNQSLTLRFFFWNAGTKLQKSLEGAFRALLFQALGHDLSLASVVLESKHDLDHTSLRSQIEYVLSWSEEKLLAALIRVLTQTENKTYYVFLDGLDECDGKPRHIIDCIKQISRLAHVKACVSSRSPSIFERRLGSYPGLDLHELTKNDIQAYVHSSFKKDPLTLPLLTELTPGSSTYPETLAQTIVRRSEGVFLWVSLVVEDLCEAVWKHENIKALRRRLDNIPKELEDLMKSILEKKIDKSHRAEAAEIFRIMLELRTVELPILALAIDPYTKTASADDLINMSYSHLMERCLEVGQQLPMRTGGFLEVTSASSFSSLGTVLPRVSERNVKDFNVNFLHRSAYDFINDGQYIAEWICLDDASRECTQKAILRAKVASVCATPVMRNEGTFVASIRKFAINNSLQDVICFTNRLNRTFDKSCKEILDGLLEHTRQRFAEHHTSAGDEVSNGRLYAQIFSRFYWGSAEFYCGVRDNLGMAAYLGLYSYVSYTLESLNGNLEATATYLLHCALRRFLDIGGAGYLENDKHLPNFTSQLLHLGANSRHLVTEHVYYKPTTKDDSVVRPYRSWSTSPFDMLFRSLLRYSHRSQRGDLIWTTNLLPLVFQISDVFLEASNALDLMAVTRRSRIVIKLTPENARSSQANCYLHVTIAASNGVFLMQCYKAVGRWNPILERLKHIEEETNWVKVVGIGMEIYHMDPFDSVMKEYNLTDDESERFTPFQQAISELFLPVDKLFSEKREELFNLVADILSSRGLTLKQALGTFKPIPDERTFPAIEFD